MLGTFMKNLSKQSRFDYNCAKISGTLREDLSTLFIADDIKSPSERSLQVNWYQPVRLGREVQTLSERARMFCYMYVACLVLVCHCLAFGVMCVVEYRVKQ
jgi:hypothetical protein